jgi:probable HAF family extracellular repeat protein
MSWYGAVIERKRHIPRRVTWRGRAALALAGSVLAGGAVAGPAAATPSPAVASGNYVFTTLNDNADPTFNQLLGINREGLIAGYFGSGAMGHPNQGYLLSPPYGQGSYQNENFPGSVQTQVTGLNNRGTSVGFWVDGAGNNFGFYRSQNRFHSVNFPSADNANPQVDQLLGVNDRRVAVGFYTDSNGNNHGYIYRIRSHRFGRVNVPGSSSVTATAINNLGDVAGFDTSSSGTVQSFLRQNGGRMITLNFPGASATQAFGVNDGDEVVGSYTLGAGSTATMHGFVWAPRVGFQSVDDPNGVGATTVNGVNDRGQLVGFYVDAAGNTDGMLADPNG